MKTTRWILLIVFSGLLGVCLVQYLVAPPIEISLYLTISLTALFVLGLVITLLFRRKRRLFPLTIAGLLFIISFLVTNMQFLTQEIDHHLPVLTRQTADTGDGHTAVIYFTHGEPTAYSPNAWLETMTHLDEDKVPFVPKPFRPFFFNGIRSEYLIVGGSIHNYMHRHMIDSLEALMHAQDNPDLKFYLSFLDTDPRPDAAVIQALNDGASRIVIMPVFLTISSHTAEGLLLVEALDLTSFGVSTCVSDPLWDSASLKAMFIARVNNNLGETSKADVGIMLIGHGQPEEWDLLYPTQTEQENIFRMDVRNLLIAEGYPPENIVLSWMEFKSPEIADGAQTLFNNQVKKLLVFPASISATSIHTDIEIPAAIADAGVPPGVEVVDLGAWNDDPLVIEGIRQNVLSCLP